MMKILIVIVSVLLMAGCATIQPSFEDSNQYFIERTIDKLKVGEAIKKKIPMGNKMAVVSLEENTAMGRPIVAVLEDQIIRSLITNGYKVMERDATNIHNLIREGKNYSLSFPYYPKVMEVENASADSFKPGIHLQPTSLKSADYLLSYRVLEAGIIYRENDPGSLSPGKKTRESLVRLHVRVVNANSGEIQFAENLTATITDKIPTTFIFPLASFHYSFFPYEYPVQGSRIESTIVEVPSTPDVTARQKISKTIMWYVGGSFLLLLLLGGA